MKLRGLKSGYCGICLQRADINVALNIIFHYEVSFQPYIRERLDLEGPTWLWNLKEPSNRPQSKQPLTDAKELKNMFKQLE